MKTPAQKVQDALGNVAHTVNNNLADLQAQYNGDRTRFAWCGEIIDALEEWGKASNDFLHSASEPVVRFIALDQKVLAVATTRVDGWTAYVGAVPGEAHSKEFWDVRNNGTKLPEEVARALFGHLPEFAPSVRFCL